MENQTLLVAFSVSVLVFFVTPVYGLIGYTAALLCYPDNLTVKVGTIDFSAGRIIIIALFMNIFLKTDLAKRFKLVWLDKLVLIFFAAQMLSGVRNVPFMKLLENRGGAFFDWALPYFAVRLILTKKEDYITFLKAVLWVVGALGILAFYEAITAQNPLDFGRNRGHVGARWGLTRAILSFRHPIYLGVFFTMAGAVGAGLLKSLKKNVGFYILCLGSACLGVFSTVSSGPLLSAISAIAFIAFYRFRQYWKAAILTIVIGCFIVEIISNRHFYDVIDRVAFNSSTAWYRTRLIEIAFFEGGMSGHWITGYGFDEPGWGYRIDRRDHTDMVNHYLLVLCCYGLVGFIPFCAMIIAAIKKIFEGFWQLQSEEDTWMVWCLVGGLFGVLMAFNSVSLFGQPTNFFFMMLGFCVVLPNLVEQSASRSLTYDRSVHKVFTPELVT